MSQLHAGNLSLFCMRLCLEISYLAQCFELSSDGWGGLVLNAGHNI